MHTVCAAVQYHKRSGGILFTSCLGIPAAESGTICGDGTCALYCIRIEPEELPHTWSILGELIQEAK